MQKLLAVLTLVAALLLSRQESAQAQGGTCGFVCGVYCPVHSNEGNPAQVCASYFGSGCVYWSCQFVAGNVNMKCIRCDVGSIA